MRKVMSILLLLAVLMSSVICVRAAEAQVVFVAGSAFKVGGTVTVDLQKTAQNVMNSFDASSAMYKAAQAGNMDVMWKCSNGSDKMGSPITWASSDAGKEYVCRVGFYSDNARTEFVDYIDSNPIVIAASKTEEVRITPVGPFNATVGEYFMQQVGCAVADATYAAYGSSMPEGLSISSGGLITGTPKKAGNWSVTIAAYKNGEVLGCSVIEFAITGKNEDPPKISTTHLPDAIVGEAYSTYILCNDNSAEFGEYYNPGGPNDLSKTGLSISADGKLSGTPTKAGTYSFCVYAGNDYGETQKKFTLTVKEATISDEPQYTIMVLQGPDKTEYISGEKLDLTGMHVQIKGPDGTIDSWHGEHLTYTDKALISLGEQKIALTYKDAFDIIIVTVKKGTIAAPTEPQNPTEPTEPSEPADPTDAPVSDPTAPAEDTATPPAPAEGQDDSSNNVWLFVGIGLGVAVVAVVVVIVILLKKKKA